MRWVLVAVVLALLGGGTLRADNIDRELIARAPALLRFCAARKLARVGVLKFRLAVGKEPPGDTAEPLCSNMADRLENLLVVADAGDDLAVAHAPGAQAVARDGAATQETPAGRKRLLAGKADAGLAFSVGPAGVKRLSADRLDELAAASAAALRARAGTSAGQAPSKFLGVEVLFDGRLSLRLTSRAAERIGVVCKVSGRHLVGEQIDSARRCSALVLAPGKVVLAAGYYHQREGGKLDKKPFRRERPPARADLLPAVADLVSVQVLVEGTKDTDRPSVSLRGLTEEERKGLGKRQSLDERLRLRAGLQKRPPKSRGAAEPRPAMAPEPGVMMLGETLPSPTLTEHRLIRLEVGGK